MRSSAFRGIQVIQIDLVDGLRDMAVVTSFKIYLNLKLSLLQNRRRLLAFALTYRNSKSRRPSDDPGQTSASTRYETWLPACEDI